MFRGFTLYQRPNPPLIVALLAVAGGWATTGILHTGLHLIFVVAIGIWSYLEITSGVNWFRRALGIAMALYVLIGLLRPYLG